MYSNKQLVGGLAFALLASVAGCATTGDEEATSDTTSELTLGPRVEYDAGTACSVGGVSMHCCPPGQAMIGAHINNNVFKCADLAFSGGPFLDSGTVRNGMHACPSGSVMVGLHVNRNLLACEFPSQGVSFEYVDGNPGTVDGFPMHVCSTSYAMAGIHVNNNLFTCDF